MPCMLFGIGSDNTDLGVLVSRPLTNFKKATDELKAHDKKASHLDAVTSADLFLKVMSVNNRLFINKPTLLLLIVWQQTKKIGSYCKDYSALWETNFCSQRARR